MQFKKSALAILTTCAATLSAQAPAKRLLHVTITDPLHRFVTGIDQKNFAVVENGVRRPITDFAGVDSPLTLAIVSETPLAEANSFNRPNDELIQTNSLPEALRQLAASKNSRKTLILTTPPDARAIPPGIQVIQVNPDILQKTVIEAHNQYLLQFETPDTTAPVEVVLEPMRGFPPLKVNLN